MKASILITLFTGTLFFLGCNSPHTLETRIGTHRSEDLKATASKEFDHWNVEVELPLGNWAVKPNEDQAVELVPGPVKSTLRWKVAPDRWAHTEKPFIFELIPDTGAPIVISVSYSQLKAGDLIGLTLEMLSFVHH